ncbi:hypothetical protein SAMN05192588_1915 [Nonlabens sp. Hel1_33_55]|nr:hypothetical protein SAMN05192588_1915 [Nonlabens sp. Hel1_33_55]
MMSPLSRKRDYYHLNNNYRTYLCQMTPLTEQELHQLAMNIVGKELEEDGYDFLAVNSKPKKDPQFVVLKNKKLNFVVVRAVTYPANPVEYDEKLMQTVYEHAVKYKARTYFAGVGLANSRDYDMPVHHEDDYVVNYAGLIEIKD